MDQRLLLTKTLIEELPTPKKGERLVFYDAKEPCLSVRVSESGTKVFTVRRKLNGRAVRTTLGRFPVMSIEQARKAAAKTNVAINDGANPNKAKRAARTTLRFEEVWENWLETHAKPHRKTWEEDERYYNSYLSHWAKKQAAEITKDDVTRLHKKVGKEHGKRTANYMLSILTSVFLKGGIDQHPCKGVQRFAEKPRERVLGPDEAEPLLKAIMEYEDETVRDFFLVLLFTGRRRGEILKLKWSQVKFDQKMILLGETKNGEKQTAFLTSMVESVLKARRNNGSPYVFPTSRSTSRTPHLQSPKKAWAIILKRAGIEDFHIHDLRSVLPSWAAQKGIGDFLIQKMTQHKDTRSLRIYQRMRDADPVRQLQESTANDVLSVAGLLPQETRHAKS